MKNLKKWQQDTKELRKYNEKLDRKNKQIRVLVFSKIEG